MKTALLLMNLGTPDEPTKPAVRRYLRQFLSDPFVIDLPGFLRWILVHVLILPFRTKRSVEAYQKIWTQEGSPLRINSDRLAEKLQAALGEDYCVSLAMRYQNPSFEKAIAQFDGQSLDRMILLPLYPQYAESTTRSCLEAVRTLLKKTHPDLPITVIDSFYQQPEYLDAKTAVIRDYLKDKAYEKVVFSYHGLPERHLDRVCEINKTCDRQKSCPSIQSSNAQCYRAQCFATSTLLAEQLGLSPQDYVVSFQSRLGKTPWIGPYTDEVLTELAESGLKNIAMVCPSFVADCLETLEEIDIRAKEQWEQLGGHQLLCVPCLNDASIWVDQLSELIKKSK